MKLKVWVHSFAIILTFLGWFTESISSTTPNKESALEKFEAGHFLDAAEEARELGSVEGNLLAAEAMIIYAEYLAEESEKQQYLAEAIELARNAIALQPDQPEPYTVLVRGIGRYAQSIPTGKALSEGLGKELKRNIEIVLELDPHSWKGHLAYGFWHSEIVVKGGPLGMLMFNASRRKAIFHFDQATELKPDIKIFHLELAQGLQLLNARKYRKRIVTHLNKAISLPVLDAYDSLLHNRAMELLAEFGG